MKQQQILLVIFPLILISTLAKDMKDMTIDELLKLAELVAQVRPNDVVEGDVKFYLFTRDNFGNQIEDATNIDLTKETKFIIHGWLEDHQRTWYRKITKEFLDHDDYNVIQVDWNRVAKSSYRSSSQNTKLIGYAIADLIIAKNLSVENIHLVGHSLGAHVAGFAAKKIKADTGNTVRRITALDAAGPAFRHPTIGENDRLSSKDARLVDAFHTDGGFFGYENPIGTLDVYVNGGRRVQPGCIDDLKLNSLGDYIEKSFCSHAKSTLYFIEIINDKKYTCLKCETWEKYLLGGCDNNEKYIFGAEDINSNMTGVCFVKTQDNITTQVSNLLKQIIKWQ